MERTHEPLPAGAGTIAVPEGWTTARDGDRLALRGPVPGAAAPLSVLVTVGSCEGADAEAFAAAQLEAAVAAAHDPLLVDLEQGALGGVPAHRAVIAAIDGGRDVTTEHWWACVGGRGVGIRATVASREYGAARPHLAAVCADVRLAGDG